jgi:hypothetical protein
MKVKQLFEERYDDYVDRLTKTLGIKQLGFGKFSTVFQHPVYHNVAVKLVGANDPHYVTFIRRCAKLPDNPWLPKVVGVHKVNIHDKDANPRLVSMDTELDHARVHWIVFLQKLRKAKPTEIRAGIQQILSTLPDHLFSTGEAPRNLHRMHEKERRTKLLCPKPAYRSFFDFSVNTWKTIAEQSNDVHVRQLAQLMFDISANDIHDDNVMARDDGQIVITDPVAHDVM